MNRTLVLLRHGDSLWNKENRFTGWTDVGLSPKGVEEAHQAAQTLARAGISFDVGHTSLLTRSILTLHIVLEDMDLLWLPEHRSWRLNERHYGDLQGLNKKETADKFGKEQVFIWRRSYEVSPPPLAADDPRHSRFDPRYRGLTADLLPATESLRDVVGRFLPYWHDVIAPQLMDGKRVLVSAHGNSLRALVKHLDQISDQDIPQLNIPTGIPLVYQMDEALNPVERHYLGDPRKISGALKAVAVQAGGKTG
ncbi:MAG: 2,3-diphosphoglycerate-dependent phosphoglycerate mutase [Bradymonadales bacterium]|nr:2,3-diphosphoglycerate-dependent phosphoglycerate mutase [Bradymonadales bacterium]